VTVVLDFFVPGAPKTKGSLTPRAAPCRCTPTCPGFSRQPQLRDSVGSSRWRKLVAYQAGVEMRRVAYAWPLAGPVGLELTYYLPVADEAALIEQGSGDLDKLERNIYDALQDAGVYANDAQVVACGHQKRVAPCGGPGVRVQVIVDDER
jgi:Holliday junction resolvase RusA-like endonuclease